MTSSLFRLYEPVLNQSLFNRLPNELLDRIWEEKLRLEQRILHRTCMAELRGVIIVPEDSLRKFVLDGLEGSSSSEEFWEIIDELWLANLRKPVECSIWSVDGLQVMEGRPVITAVIRCDYMQDSGEMEMILVWSQYRWVSGKLLSGWRLHHMCNWNFRASNKE